MITAPSLEAFRGGGQGRPRGVDALLVSVRLLLHQYSTPYQLVMVGGGRSPDVAAVCVRARLFARALQGVSLHTCSHARVCVYLGVIGEWADSSVFQT